MSEVRLGIVGVGVIGKNHSGYLSRGEVEGMKITAVCDIDPEQLTWAKENLGEEVELFEDAEAMYDSGKIDAVLVATPHYDHPPLAIKAFQRGLHVMVEKPAGVYSKQVLELNKAAEKSGKVFGIIFQMRGIPVLAKVKELLDSGEAGEQVRSVWISTFPFRSQSYYDSGTWRATWGGEGGGVLVNQAPHQLDLWQWMCGMPQSIMSKVIFGAHRDIVTDNDVTVIADYGNGATGVFITCTHDVIGTNRLEIDLDAGKIVVEKSRDATVYRLIKSEDVMNQTMTTRDVGRLVRGGNVDEVYTTETIDTSGGWGQQHLLVLENFAANILDGTPLIAPGTDGINGVQIANAILLSSWLGREVQVPVDEDLYLAELNKRIAEEGKYPTRK